MAASQAKCDFSPSTVPEGTLRRIEMCVDGHITAAGESPPAGGTSAGTLPSTGSPAESVDPETYESSRPEAAIGPCRKILVRDVARYALAALAGVHPENYNLPCLTNQWEGEL